LKLSVYRVETLISRLKIGEIEATVSSGLLRHGNDATAVTVRAGQTHGDPRLGLVGGLVDHDAFDRAVCRRERVPAGKDC
jgi:hypothetical protein